MAMFNRSKSFYQRHYINPKRHYKTHLEEVNMTYFQHLKHAHGFGYIFFKHSVQSIIHGLFPECYKQCATDGIKKLSQYKLNAISSGNLEDNKRSPKTICTSKSEGGSCRDCKKFPKT